MAEEQQHNRLWYRINASRAITGGRKLIPSLNKHMNEVSTSTSWVRACKGPGVGSSSWVDVGGNDTLCVCIELSEYLKLTHRLQPLMTTCRDAENTDTLYCFGGNVLPFGQIPFLA